MRSTIISLILLMIVSSTFADQCSMPESQRSDCGYVGVNQSQCESKGCCWSPAGQGSAAPWCFYTSDQNPCKEINLNGQSQPFTDSNFEALYQNFMANINIQGKGGVLASPDTQVPGGGSYYYAWERDGALSMRAFMEVNDYDLNKIDANMQSYVGWVSRVHAEQSPNNIDIRGEVKFNLPEGDVVTQAWCRPQNDGAGLQALALTLYANALIKGGKTDYVNRNLWTGSSLLNGGHIKFDLDYVVDNWNLPSCDLWEEIRVSDLFWNRLTSRHALKLGAALAGSLGDVASQQKYLKAAQNIQDAIDASWNSQFIQESTSRQMDGASIVALNVGYADDQYYSPIDTKVAQTVAAYNNMFCNEYQINQADDKAGIPGIMYGRYHGDTYGGGNPWILSTGALADLFYRGAVFSLKQSEQLTLTKEQHSAWSKLFPQLKETSSLHELAQNLTSAGDAVMTRLYNHVKNDNNHLAEQIDRNTGKQGSATDLTWSYAEVLQPIHRRKQITKMMNTEIQNLELKFLSQ